MLSADMDGPADPAGSGESDPDLDSSLRLHGLGAALAEISVHDAAVALMIKRGLRAAFDTDGSGVQQIQVRIVDLLVDRFMVVGVPSLAEVEPADPKELADLLQTEAGKNLFAHLCVLLELCSDPVRPEEEAQVESYLRAVGLSIPEVVIARDTAHRHIVLLHADLLRNSWYTEQTVIGAATGKLWEYTRSKLAYYGIVGDDKVAARWRSLADNEPGTWGRSVADFYSAHNFPLPGERHGIYEIGALHDWVHVLADYSTNPDGEINVFAFIAATMDDSRGFVLFLFTLALFQNASVDTVGGLPVAIARSGTLSDPESPRKLADALWRASKCTADPMGGVDHFAMAGESLQGLRDRWSIPAKSVPSPSAHDVVDQWGHLVE